MDLVLSICDDLFLDTVWSRALPSPLNHAISSWPRDYIPRQLVSLTVVTLIGIHAFYFIFAWISYRYVFNHEMMNHPRFLKNQIKLEIQTSLWSFPGMTLLTLPWFQAEIMGYSRLYDRVEDYGWPYLLFSTLLYAPARLSVCSGPHL